MVAVLGLIHLTIRSIAIGQGMGLANAPKIIETDLHRAEPQDYGQLHGAAAAEPAGHLP
jgi:hypothetical protein